MPRNGNPETRAKHLIKAARTRNEVKQDVLGVIVSVPGRINDLPHVSRAAVCCSHGKAERLTHAGPATR